MKYFKLLLTAIIMFSFCAIDTYAQKKNSSFEERIQERKALLNAETDRDRVSKEFIHKAKRSKMTDNYQMHYTPRNTGDNELSSFYLDNIFVDSKGRYYFSSNYSFRYAVDVLDNEVWNHLDAGEALQARVNVFAEDGEGNIWGGTEAGLQKFNSNLVSEDVIIINTEDTLSNRVVQMLFDGDGNLWTASSPYTMYGWSGNEIVPISVLGVVTILNPGTGSVITVADTIETGLESSIAVEGVRDFAVDGDGNIWAATSAGIAVYSSDLSAGSSYTTGNSGLPVNNVIEIETDQNGDMWVAFHPDSSDVVAHFDGTNWTSFDEVDIPSGECISLTFASGNQLYCGGEAVYVYDGVSWSEVTDVSVKGETLDGAVQITSNQNGVEIFNYRPGVFIKDGENWEYLSSHTDNGLPGNPVYGVSADFDGGFWASGRYGTTYFDGSTWTYYDESDGLSYSWKIHAASNGTVWFGTVNDMTYLKDGEFTIVDEFSGFYGEDIYEDRDGNIWMGSFARYGDTTYSASPGILKYDGTDFTLFPSDTSVIGSINFGFAQGPDGMVYATSVSNEFSSFRHLIRYDGEEWSPWLHSSITGIDYTKLVTDDDQNLWFIAQDNSYAYKLMKWDGENLTKYSMPSDAGCYGYKEALEADAEGNIWVGCVDTVAILKIADESWVTHDLFGATVLDISHDGNGTTWVVTGYTYGGILEFNTQRAVPIEEVAATIPEQFELKQNYPNPFNPTTTIGYDLPVSSLVTLKVYDLLGREIATLVNAQQQSSGQHHISFDASSLASGMYIYRLESSSFTAIKKMMLIK